jgi:hypothetical protein
MFSLLFYQSANKLSAKIKAKKQENKPQTTEVKK